MFNAFWKGLKFGFNWWTWIQMSLMCCLKCKVQSSSKFVIIGFTSTLFDTFLLSYRWKMVVFKQKNEFKNTTRHMAKRYASLVTHIHLSNYFLCFSFQKVLFPSHHNSRAVTLSNFSVSFYNRFVPKNKSVE